MYEPGLFDIVEVTTVLSTTFCGAVKPTWAPPAPINGPARNLQSCIDEAMGNLSMATETNPVWLHFMDENTVDVAFVIGPVTHSAPAFHAEGDTVEFHLGGDPISESAQVFSGRMYREDQSWVVARETVLQVLERFGISPHPDS